MWALDIYKALGTFLDFSKSERASSPLKKDSFLFIRMLFPVEALTLLSPLMWLERRGDSSGPQSRLFLRSLTLCTVLF